ncbi:hypothetical protein PT2222_120354 [Paraburkholderia tropica]
MKILISNKLLYGYHKFFSLFHQCYGYLLFLLEF